MKARGQGQLSAAGFREKMHRRRVMKRKSYRTCPLCGKKALRRERFDSYADLWMTNVFCSASRNPCCGGYASHTNKATARRAAMAAFVAAVEVLRGEE